MPLILFGFLECDPAPRRFRTDFFENYFSFDASACRKTLFNTATAMQYHDRYAIPR